MYWTSRGAKLYFSVQGQGLPVLCLPPFPFNHAFYSRQSALVDAARLILVDYPGTGRSAEAREVSLELLAQDVTALLDALGLDRVVTLGVSLGGYVALALCALAPQRVMGLVLADTRSEADPPEAVLQRAQTAEELKQKGAGVLKERVSRLFGATTHREQPELVRAAQALVEREHAQGLAQLSLAMGQRPDRSALLASIRCPTLVLCGAEDTVTPPAGMEQLAAAVPGAVFRQIPRAGHLAAQEQPEAFNQAVRNFLQRMSLHGA
ncbi:MAG: alpha/beta fold hydrolase [candidate division FCPU426 bacterium]